MKIKKWQRFLCDYFRKNGHDYRFASTCVRNGEIQFDRYFCKKCNSEMHVYGVGGKVQ